MKKFEYLLVDATSGFLRGINYQELTEHLNSLGQQGWEVVAVVDTALTNNHNRGLVVTLKRELLG